MCKGKGVATTKGLQRACDKTEKSIKVKVAGLTYRGGKAPGWRRRRRRSRTPCQWFTLKQCHINEYVFGLADGYMSTRRLVCVVSLIDRTEPVIKINFSSFAANVAFVISIKCYIARGGRNVHNKMRFVFAQI